MDDKVMRLVYKKRRISEDRGVLISYIIVTLQGKGLLSVLKLVLG